MESPGGWFVNESAICRKQSDDFWYRRNRTLRQRQQSSECQRGLVLTLGADQTLRGAGELGLNQGGLLNLGTMIADGNIPLTFDPAVANNFTIRERSAQPGLAA